MKHTDDDSIRFNLSKQRIQLIKQKIKAREREKKKELERLAIASMPTLSELKVIPKNEITYNSMFARNPFDKKNMISFNFSKHKMNIEISNRNMQRNRIEYVVKQVSLHYIKAKSRLHLNDGDLLQELQQKIARNTKRQNTKIARFAMKQSSSIRNNNITEMNKESEGNNINNDSNEYNEYNEYKDMIINTVSDYHYPKNTQLNTKSQNQIIETQPETQPETKPNTKIHQRSKTPYTCRNNNSIQNYNPLSIKTNSDSIKIKSESKKRNSLFFQSEKKSVVIHKPIYTKRINEFFKDHQRLKKQLKKEEKSNYNLVYI